MALKSQETNRLFPGPDAAAPISYTLFRAELARDSIEAIHSEVQTIEGRLLVTALMKQGSLDENEILDVTALPPAPPLSDPRLL